MLGINCVTGAGDRVDEPEIGVLAASAASIPPGNCTPADASARAKSFRTLAFPSRIENVWRAPTTDSMRRMEME